MSRQVCTTVYKFSELSDKAKERALDVFRNYNVDDSFWYESIIDDAKHMGSLMGIDVTNILFAGFLESR